MLVDFACPPAPRCRPIHRSHPLIAVLAETLLERTLSGRQRRREWRPSVLGRVGCWIADGVRVRTIVVLLRLRHQLQIRKAQRETTLLVEEANAIAWEGVHINVRLVGGKALGLLTQPPVADPPQHVREREIERALSFCAERAGELDAFAAERAQSLLEDHLRVRDASKAAGTTSVLGLPHPDVVGVFVLLPRLG